MNTPRGLNRDAPGRQAAPKSGELVGDLNRAGTSAGGSHGRAGNAEHEPPEVLAEVPRHAPIPQQLDLPLATINAEGTHHARADAFMVAYYGNEKDGQAISDPMRTLTTKERLGLVRVDGDLYQIVDIGMRMLVPPELYMAQGFPRDYKINITFKGKPLPKDAQVRMCGNSVSPYPCAALVRAQFEEQVSEAAA